MTNIDFVFLTREGCVHTQDMLNNVDVALSALGLVVNYQVINLASLPENDARRGYPTPTLLVQGQDLYGMPMVPFPEPA